MSEPLFTVAVPTMNGSRHVAKTLGAILGQTGAHFDLLVSDDRSDDDTLAVVASVAGDRARVVVNAERLGLAGNWNQCVALSRTPFVAIVHQDDILLPGHLEAHLEALRSDDSVGLVASASGVIDDAGREVPEAIVGRGGLGPVDRTFAPGHALPLMAAANPLRCSAVSLRAQALAKSGGFDPSLRYVVDWDCWLRIARDWSIAWRSRPSVLVRWHDASETHRFKTGTIDLEETERIMKAWLPGCRGLERTARRGLARAYLNRAYETSCAGEGRLARRCLTRALTLRPGLLGALAADPRLAIRMAAVAAAPGAASRWFSRSS